MRETNHKIIVIIDSKGIRSVAVHADDDKSRSTGYETCIALEPALMDANRIVHELYLESIKSDLKNKTKSTQVMQ